MKSFKVYLTEKIDPSKNLHLTHLEDLMMEQGYDGLENAVDFLGSIIGQMSLPDSPMRLVKPESDVQLKVKWDGAPAVVCGINPDNNKFFVGTKAVFNKLNPKINYTEKDIDKNHEQPGLREKLKTCLKYLPELGIKTIYQGDLLFTEDDKRIAVANNIPQIIFRPNTITYAVPYNKSKPSELAVRILRAKMGIVFHTEYRGQTFDSLKATLRIDLRGLKKSPNVFVVDADYDQPNSKAVFSPTDLKDVKNNFVELQNLSKKADKLFWDTLSKGKVYEHMSLFNNLLIKLKDNRGDAKHKAEMFLSFVEDQFRKEIDALKTDKGKERKKAEGNALLQMLKKNKDQLILFYQIQQLLVNLKLIIIKALEQISSISAYIEGEGGELQPTRPEGFVAVSDKGVVKLIDRDTFSYFNFNLQKNW